MYWKLFADLAEAAGRREVDVEGGETVGEALDALLSDRPDLEARVLDESGAVREDVTVLRNGEALDGEGLDAPVDDGDELALFPPVSGG